MIPTRDRLLAAAAQDFAAHGFVGAKLADIAAAAGVRRPSLIHHFGSKQALYSSVVERVFGELGAALAGAMEGLGDFEQRLLDMTRQFSDFLRERPEIARLLLREVLDGRGPGQAILLEQAVPMLRMVEDFVDREGGARIPAGFPLRASLMQAVANVVLWSAAGALRGPLWGESHKAVELTRVLWGIAPEEER